MLLGHLLVLLLPLVTLVLEGLHLAFKVAGLDIGLTKPRNSIMLAKVIQERTEAKRAFRFFASALHTFR